MLRELCQAGIQLTKAIATWTKSEVGCILLTHVLFIKKMGTKEVKVRLMVHIKLLEAHGH